MSRHKSKNKVTSIKTGMVPTKERHQHNGGVMTEAIALDSEGKALMHRYRAVWECPLDAYKDKKIITEPEYLSGLGFRKAYYRAVLSRRTGYERLNTSPMDTSLTPSERILRDAYRILPFYNKGTIIAICGHDQPAQTMDALEKLRKGLGHLAVAWHSAAIETCEHRRK